MEEWASPGDCVFMRVRKVAARGVKEKQGRGSH